MKKSHVLILVSLGLLFSFGLGFISGWQGRASTDRLIWGHLIVARDETDLDASCYTLRDFNAGKTRWMTYRVQSAVDFYADRLEMEYGMNPNQQKKEVDQYKKVMAVAKEMQKNWEHIEPGSFWSTNGPGILTTNFGP